MTTLRQLLSVEVRSEQDVVLARQRARQIASLLGFDLQAQTKIGTAVSEIVRNAFRYARGGKATFQFEQDAHRRLIIRVADTGPGIANLADILTGHYDSRTGMGMGLVGTRRIMDEFEIVSVPGSGTTVTMAKFLPPRTAPVGPEVLAGIAAALAKGVPGDPVGEVQQQNQELLRVLDELQQRQAEVQAVNRELEDTNRGVVALYAELDARADFLRKASEVKSRFLSNMTHEFRTPLNSIIALASMLANRTDGELTGEQERQVGFIARSAESLAGLVNDLLDIAKVEAGKVTVKPVDFAVDDLFGSLKGMLKPLLAGNATVSLHIDVPDEPLRLHTDEGKVSQVLRNLISNALKFTESGEVRVTVTPSAPGRIAFSVTDTGVGIRSEDIGRIFDEFGQVETGVSQRFKGSGLGLPLSKRLAELLGGRLSVTSRAGIGSTFVLDIPAQYAGAAQASLVEADIQPAEGVFKRQVLIIDDDEVSRYLLKGLLPLSFEVIEASSGALGMDAAKRLHPDVVFLDLYMPNLSGFEVLELLKDDPETHDIRVVIYSAQVMDERTCARLVRADAILAAKGTDPQSARAATLAALEQVGLIANRPGAA
ncbi:MAG: ATP-binding protein [Planctomycetes bacterium]|nr:ATP-binding protein [Planctomycetota bacterium]